MSYQPELPEWLHAEMAQHGYGSLQSLCSWAHDLYEHTSGDLPTIEVVMIERENSKPALRAFARVDNLELDSDAQYLHGFIDSTQKLNAFIERLKTHYCMNCGNPAKDCCCL